MGVFLAHSESGREICFNFPSMKERCVALLGRRDEPTDAVEEYCHFLGAALAAQGISLEFERVPWCELGWRKALAGMDRGEGRLGKGWELHSVNRCPWTL